MTIDTKFDQGLADLSRRYRLLGEHVTNVVNGGVERIGAIAAQRAASLTPRAEFDPVYPDRAGKGGHIADFWRSTSKKAGAGVTVRVLNVHPRANKKTRGPWTVLEILEYGSGPHPIEANSKPALVFWSVRDKVRVKTQKVEHKGTRPYGMLAISRVEADIAMKRLLDTLRTEIRKTGKGK